VKQRAARRRSRLFGLLRAFRDAAAALPDALVAIDGHQHILWFNAAAGRLFGLLYPQHLDQRLGDVVALPGFIEWIEAGGVDALADVAAPGDPDVHLSLRLIPYAEDHALLLGRDISQVLRLEKVRRDFVANVSHELKTPVGGISLLSEAIIDARDDPEAVARFGERIRVESDRLGRLVKEIVDLSRLQVQDTLHEPEPVDLGSVIGEAVDRVRVTAESHGVVIEAATEPGLTVFGDRELLTTAVANLVSNAVNYSDSDTKVAVASRRAGEFAEITVTDQGHGIPAGEQQRIFERFYRVDAARSRATGGTGLGLAIVKHICTNHGGEVTVWSDEGHGSTFTMRLPRAIQKTVPAPTRTHDTFHSMSQGAQSA